MNVLKLIFKIQVFLRTKFTAIESFDLNLGTYSLHDSSIIHGLTILTLIGKHSTRIKRYDSPKRILI